MKHENIESSNLDSRRVVRVSFVGQVSKVLKENDVITFKTKTRKDAVLFHTTAKRLEFRKWWLTRKRNCPAPFGVRVYTTRGTTRCFYFYLYHSLENFQKKIRAKSNYLHDVRVWVE